MSIDYLQDKIRKTKNPSMISLELPVSALPPHILAQTETKAEAYAVFFDALLTGLKGTVGAVRIPWGMLNFANPMQRLVHKDYYENYGVDFQEIKTIALGMGLGEDTIPMKALPLKWKEKPYEERCKQSYYMIQAFWR